MSQCLGWEYIAIGVIALITLIYSVLTFLHWWRVRQECKAVLLEEQMADKASTSLKGKTFAIVITGEKSGPGSVAKTLKDALRYDAGIAVRFLPEETRAQIAHGVYNAIPDGVWVILGEVVDKKLFWGRVSRTVKAYAINRQNLTTPECRITVKGWHDELNSALAYRIMGAVSDAAYMILPDLPKK